MMKKSGTGHPDEFLNEIIGDGVSFARIRRITGYLVGDMERWNDAKKAEEADRVKHFSVSNPVPDESFSPR